MPGTIHVKNARRRVTFASRQTRPIVQRHEKTPSKQAGINESTRLTSTTINCDLTPRVEFNKPYLAFSTSTDKFSHSASQMATNGQNLTPDWTVSTAWPPIRDELETETSASQDKTVQQCLPLLHAYDSSLRDYHHNDLPKLDRAKHARFLHRSLQTLPAVAVGYDASRPWMVYWALTALSILGEDVTPYRERYLSGQATAPTARSWSAG